MTNKPIIDSRLLQYVGQEPKTLRQRQNMSVDEVQAVTGLAMTEIEKGHLDIPLDRLALLCDCYRISLPEFFIEIERQLG